MKETLSSVCVGLCQSLTLSVTLFAVTNVLDVTETKTPLGNR